MIISIYLLLHIFLMDLKIFLVFNISYFFSHFLSSENHQIFIPRKSRKSKNSSQRVDRKDIYAIYHFYTCSFIAEGVNQLIPVGLIEFLRVLSEKV